jgi:AraC-like DNA-binding protein
MPRTFERDSGKSDYAQAGNGVSRDECAVQDDKKLLEALRHSKLYRDYERTFTEVTGLPLALRPLEFFGLPFHGKKNENAFCAFLADGKNACSFCLQTQSRVAESAARCPRSIQCPFGLTETAVPIRLGERVIGFLCTGQVFTQPIKPGDSRFQRKRLFPEASPAGEKALRLWKQTPYVEATKYKAMVRLLIFFAKQLSAVSNQLLIEETCREPAVVMRARRFIAENKRGRLSLASVAKASGASMYHFCTLFHQTTGLKFTEYVARTRVEHARELLCNRRLRMYEVAYEAGFQSSTAFHRTFQRILGQSPTEYRSGLRINGRAMKLSSSGAIESCRKQDLARNAQQFAKTVEQTFRGERIITQNSIQL